MIKETDRQKKIRELKAEVSKLEEEEEKEPSNIEVYIDMTGDGIGTIIKKEEVELFVPTMQYHTYPEPQKIFLLSVEDDRVSLIRKTTQSEYYLEKRFYGLPPYENKKLTIPEVRKLIKEALILKYK